MLFSDPGTLKARDVIGWRRLCVAGLDSEIKKANEALKKGASPGPAVEEVIPKPSKVRLDAYLECGRAELDLMATFTLIAATEAKIRIDARNRANTPSASGDLGGRLKHLYAKSTNQWQVPLYDHGILEAWKLAARSANCTTVGDAVGAFGQLLKVRHWTAHGRYWTVKADLLRVTSVAVANAVERLSSELSTLCVEMGWPPFPAIPTPHSVNSRK